MIELSEIQALREADRLLTRARGLPLDDCVPLLDRVLDLLAHARQRVGEARDGASLLARERAGKAAAYADEARRDSE